MAWVDGARGALLDIDGTLLVGDRAVDGASDCLRRLRDAGVPYRLFTNTTRRSVAEIASTLRGAGIEVAAAEVLAPAALACRRILDSGRTRAALLVAPSTLDDFAGVAEDESAPQWVVLGDLGRGFDWDVLNRAFHWLRGGARLLALHKNRFWHDGERGVLLDAGGFVVALEYAAGVTAEVVGKPSPAFYAIALQLLGVPAAETLVVGDDVINEGVGAAAVGCRTAIVRTGKFEPAHLAGAAFEPDLLLASVAELRPGQAGAEV